MAFSKFGGMILPVAFSSLVPAGFLPCEGGQVSRTVYADLNALFAADGYPFGDGDGLLTFDLPNFMGCTPIGAGSGYLLGAATGEGRHALTPSEIPVHTHQLIAEHSHTTGNPTNALPGIGGGNIYDATSDGSQLSDMAVGVTGLAQPHQNRSPYSSVRFLIAYEDIDPPYEIAEMRLWPGSTLPSTGWVFADGAAYSPTGSMADLFAVIGYSYTYGATGGFFNVPDMRGRMALCAGTGNFIGASGQLPIYAIGATGGVATVKLVEDTIPAHAHSLGAWVQRNTSGTTPTPSGAVLSVVLPPAPGPYDYLSAGPPVDMAAAAVTNVGGDGYHNNVMPSIPVNYIIAFAL